MKLATASIVLFFICIAATSNRNDHIKEGTPVAWRLKDESIVRFFWLQHSPVGRDTAKYFEIATRPVISCKTFQFAATHAGYLNVELRTNNDQSLLWLVDVSRPEQKRLGCSFDRKSGAFVDEGGDHPDGVSVDSGNIVEPFEDGISD